MRDVGHGSTVYGTLVPFQLVSAQGDLGAEVGCGFVEVP